MKPEEKRQAILDVAAQAFRELGFERTSMSEIRARVGGSKETLYHYFPSKEILFFEVMSRSTEAASPSTTASCDLGVGTYRSRAVCVREWRTPQSESGIDVPP